MPADTPIHVVPDTRGHWFVRREGDSEALSEHTSTTDAERAARECALGASAVIVIHDRYGRIAHPRPTVRRPPRR